MPTAPHPPTQVDLASEADLAEVEAALRGINAEAGITRCQRCDIDLGLILNTGIYSAAGVERLQAAPAEEGAAAAADGGEGGAEAQCGDPQCADPEHHHHHQHGSHDDACAPAHDGRVGTVTIALPPGRSLDLARLRHWLDTLLWEGTADAVDLFRIKGLLSVAGSERKHILQARPRGMAAPRGCCLRLHVSLVGWPSYPPWHRPPTCTLPWHLQGVHELYDVVEGPAWAPGEPRACKLVFIGRRLRRAALAADLQACLADV